MNEQNEIASRRLDTESRRRRGAGPASADESDVRIFLRQAPSEALGAVVDDNMLEFVRPLMLDAANSFIDIGRRINGQRNN